MSPNGDLETASGASGESFELLEPLGKGGFAHTYRARVIDQDLREEFGVEEVALKIPLDKKKQRVLAREVEMGASLHLRLKGIQSLNIVRYLGFEVFRGQIVMVMEYVAQGSLRRLLGDVGRQRRLPIDEAVKMAEGVLGGLEMIHQEHVFHRDIKPENILLQGKTPKIADLGIARMLDMNEQASSTAGTLYYMSPEILSEEGASFTSDIWSLGVTLYEMVTGKLPFGGPRTPFGTMADIIRKANFIPANEVCTEIPAALDEIIARALRRRPSDRYSSASEMRLALQEFRKMTEDQIEREIAAIRNTPTTVDDTGAMEHKLRALVAKYPKDARAYLHLGEFYNGCQRYPEAIEAFKKGIEVNASSALLHWDLALAYQRTGQRGDAVRSLEKAMQLGLDTSMQRHAGSLLKVLRGSGG